MTKADRILIENNLEVAKMMLDEIVLDDDVEIRQDDVNDLIEFIAEMTAILKK